jgi:ribosome-associated protein
MKKLITIIEHALDELKALNINIIDVRALTNVTEHMIIATGTSTKHVKAIADNVLRRANEHAYKPLGIEGENEADWVLLDLNDAIVHVMLAETREYYQLDKLWSFKTKKQQLAGNE